MSWEFLASVINAVFYYIKLTPVDITDVLISISVWSFIRFRQTLAGRNALVNLCSVVLVIIYMVYVKYIFFCSEPLKYNGVKFSYL